MVYAVAFLLFLVRLSTTEIPPIDEDDPELYRTWTTPKGFEFWWRYSPGAEFVGNLFAGRAQFPWVVDIRIIDKDSEIWSVGNLLTFSHVLTSARGIIIPAGYETYQINQEDVDNDQAMGLSLEHTQIHINHCGTYLWEDYKFNARRKWRLFAEADLFATDVKITGSRYARFMFRHPKWNQNTIAWDIGVIKLNHPIRPFPPVVDMMPFWFNYQSHTITDVDLANMEDQKRICYIASFGKNWFNLYGSIVHDYKIKYRVYYTDIQKCKDVIHLYRPTLWLFPLEWDEAQRGDDPKHLWCFETRARVGAVCDHDRGAPLVCDGLVYGFLVRGANYTHCNNLLPLPFFVQRSTLLNSYFASVISHVFIPNWQKPTRRPPESRSGSSGLNAPGRLQVLSFLVLLWHSMSNQKSTIRKA